MSEKTTYSCWVKCSCNTEYKISAEFGGGFLGLNRSVQWKKNKCPTCGKKTEVRNFEPVLCPHCGETVFVREKSTAEETRVCFKCGRSLKKEKKSQIRVPCPKCGIKTSVDWDETKNKETKDDVVVCRCSSCQESILAKDVRKYWEMRENKDKLAIISLACPDGYVEYCHPLDEFPYKSQINVLENSWAICLQNGECKEVWEPGNYTLTESKLDSAVRALESSEGDGTIYRTKIYCFNRHPAGFNFLTAMEIDNGTREFLGSVRGSIHLELFDAKAFAETYGYKDMIWQELVDTTGGAVISEGFKVPAVTPFYEMLRTKMRTVISENLQEYFDKALEGPSVSIDLLPALQEKAANIQTALNDCLGIQGLRVHILNFISSELNESPSSVESRKQEAENKENVLLFTENIFYFGKDGQSEAVRVREPADETLFIDFRFNGSCLLRVDDKELFFAQSAVKTFLKTKKTPDELKKEVTAYWEEEISRRLYAFYSYVLPQLVQSAQTDIRFLAQSLGMLSDSLKNYLNNNLNIFGLTVTDVAMGKPEEIYSYALTGKTKLADTKANDGYARELKRWESEGRLADLQIEESEKTRTQEIRNREELERTKNASGYAAASVSTIASSNMAVDDTETEKELHFNENKKKRTASAAGYTMFANSSDTEVQKQKIRNTADVDITVRDVQEEEEDHSRERAADTKYKDFEWEYRLEKAREQAKIELRVLQNRAAFSEDNEKQAHDQEKSRMDFDFDWEKKLLEGRYQVELDGIMRKIDQSEFDWKQKLEEYDRLRRLTGLKDQQDQKRSDAELDALITGLLHDEKLREQKNQFGQDEFEAETKEGFSRKIKREDNAIDIEYLKAKLGLTMEEKEFLQKMADMDENRRQRGLDADGARKQTEFEQQLKLYRENIADRMEQLKLIFAAYEKQWEYQDKARESKEETERLRLKLEAYKNEVKNHCDVEIQKAVSEASAREAEARYKAEYEEKAAEKRAQEEKDRLTSAEEFAQVFKELQEKMAEINKEIKKYEFDYLTASEMYRNEADKEIARGRREDDKDERDRYEHLYTRFLELESAIREKEIERDKNRDTVFASANSASEARRIEDRLERLDKEMHSIRNKIDDLKKKMNGKQNPPANTPGIGTVPGGNGGYGNLGGGYGGFYPTV